MFASLSRSATNFPFHCQFTQCLPIINQFLAIFSTGCSFTKCTREKCDELGVKGWVKNTKSGTIMGKMQGTKASVDTM